MTALSHTQTAFAQEAQSEETSMAETEAPQVEAEVVETEGVEEKRQKSSIRSPPVSRVMFTNHFLTRMPAADPSQPGMIS